MIDMAKIRVNAASPIKLKYFLTAHSCLLKGFVYDTSAKSTHMLFAYWVTGHDNCQLWRGFRIANQEVSNYPMSAWGRLETIALDFGHIYPEQPSSAQKLTVRLTKPRSEERGFKTPLLGFYGANFSILKLPSLSSEYRSASSSPTSAEKPPLT